MLIEMSLLKTKVNLLVLISIEIISAAMIIEATLIMVMLVIN
jgi:hypothetical protein